jgi:acetyltransferase-like isoleucine patch superfamily enzyme
MTVSTQPDEEAIAYSKSLAHIPQGDSPAYNQMISGMLYNCLAPELVTSRHRARQIIHKYNSHFPDSATPESLFSDRAEILTSLLGRVGKDPVVEPPLRVDYGCNISVGDDFYANFGLVVLDCAIVRIGHRVLMGPGVSIFTATHEVGVQSRRDGLEYAVGVEIGDDCWIGGNVSIMPGVKIGRGCTIGAGSVVTRDVEEFSVAIGKCEFTLGGFGGK